MYYQLSKNIRSLTQSYIKLNLTLKTYTYMYTFAKLLKFRTFLPFTFCVSSQC